MKVRIVLWSIVVILSTILTLSVVACSPPTVEEMESGDGVVTFRSSAIISCGKNEIPQAIMNFEKAYGVTVEHWSYVDSYQRPAYLSIDW